ncbi:MAG TPA: hypothetical protein VN038_01555 [Dyadobacter sp.]|nr:hypothetical protein [Dyadobacter sp.]
MGVRVQKAPQFSGQYEVLKPEHNVNGRIQIGWLQDRFGTDENDTSMLLADPTMDRVMYFQLNLASRTAYGEKGILRMCEMAQRLMLGYRSVDISGEAYAFAATLQDFQDNVWYYRVIVRWKELPLQPLDSFITTGEEYLGGNLVEATFTPEYEQ